MKFKTDIELSLIVCTHCGNISNHREKVCDKCDSKMNQRKKYSFTKTVCFTLISIIFLVPANILPIMHITTLGTVNSSTIFGGILYFIDTKSYGIAAIIFVASIMVPIFKLMVLIYLESSKHFRHLLLF